MCKGLKIIKTNLVSMNFEEFFCINEFVRGVLSLYVYICSKLYIGVKTGDKKDY
jgi:hypothetical protein